MSATAEPTGPLLDGHASSGQIYVDGWVDAPETVDVFEPATGEKLGVGGMADAATVARACASAAAAQREWAATPIFDRIQIVSRVIGLIAAHEEELKTWIVRESGSVPAKAEVETKASMGQIQMAASLINQSFSMEIASITPGRRSFARRNPIGVVGCITPWNFPLVLAMRTIAPALVCGNAVVLKSAPDTPISGGVAIARLFEEAGLPTGLFQAFCGGADVGQALTADPNVSMMSFTGSTAAGRQVGEVCGRMLKRVVLELGGNNALVILDDADVDAASSSGAWGAFLHQGQICLAAGRHIVHESIAEEYIAKLTERAQRLPVGDPHKDEVALGPIINQRQLDRVQKIVDDTIEAGATATTGGKADGLFFPPTVLRDVTPSMSAFQNERFGPVAPVTTFKTDEEALALANSVDYGLSAAVHSSDPLRAQAFADRMESGMVHINDQTVNEEPMAPFGGVKGSGNGNHFGAVANMELWTDWQWLTSRPHAEPFPF
ncbi:MAG TPA: aldehyde dehydrogenase family protein [Solirubrobacteraceae bacterium]|nr:aldehyde dehydrogenase family protein [Solirubrobacteraceae bacterium]